MVLKTELSDIFLTKGFHMIRYVTFLCVENKGVLKERSGQTKQNQYTLPRGREGQKIRDGSKRTSHVKTSNTSVSNTIC